MSTIKIVKIYDSILNETTTKVMFENFGKKYLGPLFWQEKDWVSETVVETVAMMIFETVDTKEKLNVFLKEATNLMRENGLKVTDTTISTMAHWQFLNGFTDIIM